MGKVLAEQAVSELSGGDDLSEKPVRMKEEGIGEVLVDSTDFNQLFLKNAILVINGLRYNLVFLTHGGNKNEATFLSGCRV